MDKEFLIQYDVEDDADNSADSKYRRVIVKDTLPPVIQQLANVESTITVDHKGRWHVTLRLQALRNGKVVRETLVLDENEAIERCKMIHAARQRLESKISLMIKALAG